MSERCKGITKSGTQCKITGNLLNGYCTIHRDQFKPAQIAKKASTAPQKPAELKMSDKSPSIRNKPVIKNIPANFPLLNLGVRAGLSIAALLLGIIVIIFANPHKKR